MNPCDDVDGNYYTVKERSQCLNTTSYSDIKVGIIYNDVWAYRLCPIAKSATGSAWVMCAYDTIYLIYLCFWVISKVFMYMPAFACLLHEFLHIVLFHNIK